MKTTKLFSAVIILFSLAIFGCSEENEMDNKETGQVAVKITDAPSDDANVDGTFITVADVKVDDKSLEGFTKQTIEVSAYQQGNAKLLISEDIEAKSYNSISIVLDHESDVSGNSPGSYVLTSDGKKHDLSTESQMQSEIMFQKNFDIEANGQTSLVIDFDLRKAVTRDTETSTESDYKFVTSAEIQNSVRIVKEENAGEIEGEVSGWIDSDNQLYVFAYQKGDYEKPAETNGQGASNVLFANAVTSAKVQSDGSYTLSFLEEGEYELHVAAYQKSDNRFNFNTMLEATSEISGLLLNNVTVSSETSVKVNISIAGLM
jgi:hypothetical protein